MTQKSTQSYDLQSYDHLKEEVRRSYEKYNQSQRDKIIAMVNALEVVNFPKEKICDKVCKDLNDVVSESWIRKIIPDQYKQKSTMGDENDEDLDKKYRQLRVLEELAENGAEIEHAATQMVETLKTHRDVLEKFAVDESINKAISEIEDGNKELRETIDSIKQDQDMRIWIDGVKKAVIKLLAITKPYRYIAHVFSISTKWVSKVVKSNISKLEPAFIILEKDYKAGEKFDVMEYALNEERLAKLKGQYVEHEEEA